MQTLLTSKELTKKNKVALDETLQVSAGHVSSVIVPSKKMSFM